MTMFQCAVIGAGFIYVGMAYRTFVLQSAKIGFVWLLFAGLFGLALDRMWNL